MRATIRGDTVSEVMSHAAAVLCIHVPTFDATDAIHSERNTGDRSGSHTDMVSGRSGDIVPCLPSATHTVFVYFCVCRMRGHLITIAILDHDYRVVVERRDDRKGPPTEPCAVHCR
jgi:hypothetical protein